MVEAWRYLIDRMGSDPKRTGAIGHCMGGRLLIPFAADNPALRAIVLYYPSARDEPETPHRPRHAFHLAKTLTCASLVFCGGKDYIATPAIQGPLWQAFTASGKLVEWHFFSDATTASATPTTPASSLTTPISAGRSSPTSSSARSEAPSPCPLPQ